MFDRIKAFAEIIFGCLMCLWISVPDNVLNGRTSARKNANVASMNGVGTMLDAGTLVEDQFLNKERAMHNLPDRVSRLTVKTQVIIEWLRSARRKLQEKKYVKKQGACAERVGLPYLTVPNHTVPNQTKEGRNNNLLRVNRARERRNHTGNGETCHRDNAQRATHKRAINNRPYIIAHYKKILCASSLASVPSVRKIVPRSPIIRYY